MANHVDLSIAPEGSMWILQHKRDNRQIWIGSSYHSALRVYYRQWRDRDGSIPWDIVLVNKDIMSN